MYYHNNDFFASSCNDSNDSYSGSDDDNNDAGSLWNALEITFDLLDFADDDEAREAFKDLATFYWQMEFLCDETDGYYPSYHDCAESFVDKYGEDLWPDCENDRCRLLNHDQQLMYSQIATR